MKRRDVIALGVGGSLGALLSTSSASASPISAGNRRLQFPGARKEVFLNAAGETPLGRFAQHAMERYLDLQRTALGRDQRDYIAETLDGSRNLFAELIGAQPSEIALVHCTKAGEQLVLDRLVALRRGGNIVTNDLHFAGSLHNLAGLKQAGVDVRIVRARDWAVSPKAMQAAIDERTALVALTLVSNVNGHIESIRELTAMAHANGALVYADIIQAAGIVPIDVRAMGIDFAACSAYKWLYGVHGVGFFFVAQEHQGTALEDRSFPGSARHNYVPWVSNADPAQPEFIRKATDDASRYQPGHLSYLGYAGVYEGLKFVLRTGVESLLQHSVQLNRQLVDALDADRFRCISPHWERSPIATFLVDEALAAEIRRKLRASKIRVALGGNRLRVSSAIYNKASDIDRLVKVLQA